MHKRLTSGVGYTLRETADTVSLSIDIPPFDPEAIPHPYKVQRASFPSTGSEISFAMYVGHIFGIGANKNPDVPTDGKAWSNDEDNIRVKIGNTLTAIPGSTTEDIDYLDERNIGMRYSGLLDSTHNNVLYVEVKSDSDAGFEANLHLKTDVVAYADYDLTPPDTNIIEGKDLLKTENQWHDSPAAPTNPLTVDNVNIGTGPSQSTLTLTQKWNLYKNTHKRIGVYQIPIAYIRMIDGKWKVRQVLRSDIFFPYGLNTTTYYVGSHVESFSAGC